MEWQDEVVDPNGVVPIQLELSGREKGQSVSFSGLKLRRYSNLSPERIADAPPIEHPLDITFGDQVTLVGYKALDNGDLLLFWRRAPGAPDPAPDVHFSLQGYTSDGAELANMPGRRLGGYTFPLERWAPDQVVTGHVPAAQWLGAEPQPGNYEAVLRVYDAGDPAAHSTGHWQTGRPMSHWGRSRCGSIDQSRRWVSPQRQKAHAEDAKASRRDAKTQRGAYDVGRFVFFLFSASLRLCGRVFCVSARGLSSFPASPRSPLGCVPRSWLCCSHSSLPAAASWRWTAARCCTTSPFRRRPSRPTPTARTTPPRFSTACGARQTSASTSTMPRAGAITSGRRGGARRATTASSGAAWSTRRRPWTWATVP